MADSANNNIELFNFMKNIDFFSTLSRNSLWPLSNLAAMRHFKSGELLICEKSDPIGIFIIKTGKVKIYKTVENGSELMIAELLPGQLFGEISTLDKLKTTASARALEDVDCIFISEKDFSAQIRAYPEIGLELLPVLVKLLRSNHAK